jgi:hypothetical protein
MGACYGSHGSHSSGAIVLMDFSRLFLPDEDVLFSDAQHMPDIFFPDDMAPLEGNTLEAVVHLADIMAQFHSDCVLYIDLFHF